MFFLCVYVCVHICVMGWHTMVTGEFIKPIEISTGMTGSLQEGLRIKGLAITSGTEWSYCKPLGKWSPLQHTHTHTSTRLVLRKQTAEPTKDRTHCWCWDPQTDKPGRSRDSHLSWRNLAKVNEDLRSARKQFICPPNPTHWYHKQERRTSVEPGWIKGQIHLCG